MCSKQVREWLVFLTMEKYMHCFLERGYITIEQCQQIINSDLIMLGIDNPTHRKLLLAGVQLLINSPKLFACSEPCEFHPTNSVDINISAQFLVTCKIDLHLDVENKSNFLSRTPSPNEYINDSAFPISHTDLPNFESDELLALQMDELLN
ncbi:uncharacterized protein LOC6567501 [Drosophila grimshawi]|uniref:GH19197 n=1 Tax=Drosophila grimshawi TaxID=7222 RepID=B4JRZ9_DROGR|nr:uncharacterized protein LOC6567501 [Drosophila grimshawi]EDV94539.1 GH19197 [Drosophila grimshawi]